MEKFDVRVVYKALYAPSAKDFTQVDVPEMRYLAIDGAGDPNTAPAYAEAVQSLYTVAYTLKFGGKKSLGQDFAVGPLEGLWRADDSNAFAGGDKGAWKWTMLLPLPDWITADMVGQSGQDAFRKKQIGAIKEIRLMSLTEGLSIQILHIGSYDDEAPTLRCLHHEYMPDHGLTFNGDHHEIYLSDPRRTAPEKLKTILRQPVKPIGQSAR